MAVVHHVHMKKIIMNNIKMKNMILIDFSEFLDEAVQWIDYNTLRDLPYRDASYRPIIMIETDLEI